MSPILSNPNIPHLGGRDDLVAHHLVRQVDQLAEAGLVELVQQGGASHGQSFEVGGHVVEQAGTEVVPVDAEFTRRFGTAAGTVGIVSANVVGGLFRAASIHG